MYSYLVAEPYHIPRFNKHLSLLILQLITKYLSVLVFKPGAQAGMCLVSSVRTSVQVCVFVYVSTPKAINN